MLGSWVTWHHNLIGSVTSSWPIIRSIRKTVKSAVRLCAFIGHWCKQGLTKCVLCDCTGTYVCDHTTGRDCHKLGLNFEPRPQSIDP